MSVYVDDMKATFGRMIMCHMIADTPAELHAMADRIGVARKWFQIKDSGDHYDIAQSKRISAIRFGAIEITWRQCSFMCRRFRETGSYGTPEDAERWFRVWHLTRDL